MSQVDHAAIEQAAQTLHQGALVAFPTETVYGLGANALDGQAVARIFSTKGRPQFNPLIVHLETLEDVAKLCEIPTEAQLLAAAFWPGPLSLVLQKKTNCPVSPLVSAGLDTLAVRIPAHPVAQALLKATGVPIAAPSANRSGHVSATKAVHVSDDFKDRVKLILDGGTSNHGLESTVVAVNSAPDTHDNADSKTDRCVLLRAGAITTRALEDVLGEKIAKRYDMIGARAHSPGQTQSHYAPATPLRLNATSIQKNEALLAFGPNTPAHDGPARNLSTSGDLLEAAANLFAFLRELDSCGSQRIAAMPIPTTGLGEAINDRLTRAAAPRP